MSFILPKLYTIDKKNLIREWNIEVINYESFSEIKVIHGTFNGKQITNITKITEGKNIGKKNETSHYEQAISEAKSKWTKKKDIEKYSTMLPNNSETNHNPNNIDDENTNTQLPLSLSPMLAHEYKKHQDKLHYPCFIQKKYDGYRMIYDNKNQDMFSRNGKKYDALYDTLIHNQLKFLNYPLDGEIYCHDSEITFETYGVLRKKKRNKDKNK